MMNMRDKPTMNDVATEAAVSLGTVSKVLRGDATVAKDLRERVLAACGRLNYQRNRIAALRITPLAPRAAEPRTFGQEGETAPHD